VFNNNIFLFVILFYIKNNNILQLGIILYIEARVLASFFQTFGMVGKHFQKFWQFKK
jgi:hypothetical protein